MKKCCIIINPVSGTGNKDRIPLLVSKTLLDYEISIRYTEYAGHATEITQEAVQEAVDIVVAVGGDGTVNEIARMLVHSETALGIIPMGSGNGLARDMQIPLDTQKALDIIAKGNVTTIDYCRANDHFFFCTCGFGFDAQVSEKFSEEKHRGPLIYMKNMITEYIRFRPEYYEIQLEDQVVTQEAFLLTCANTSQYGNNAYIAPQANIHDGYMNVVIVSSMNPLEAGPFAFQLFTKQLDKNNKLHHYLSKKVKIKREKPGIIHIDGEPVEAGTEIVLETIPSGLKIIVPPSGEVQSLIQAQLDDIQWFFKELINFR